MIDRTIWPADGSRICCGGRSGICSLVPIPPAVHWRRSEGQSQVPRKSDTACPGQSVSGLRSLIATPSRDWNSGYRDGWRPCAELSRTAGDGHGDQLPGLAFPVQNPLTVLPIGSALLVRQVL